MIMQMLNLKHSDSLSLVKSVWSGMTQRTVRTARGDWFICEGY